MSIQSVLSAANSLSKLQTMQSVNSRTQGQINVLNAQIKTDGGSESKEKKVDELSEKSDSLMNNIMTELSDVNESMKPENDTEEKEENEEKVKEPKTDKIEISGKNTAVDGENTSKNIVALSAEPITYSADGEKKEEIINGETGTIDEFA